MYLVGNNYFSNSEFKQIKGCSWWLACRPDYVSAFHSGAFLRPAKLANKFFLSESSS